MRKMILVTTENKVTVLDYPTEKLGDYRAELEGFYKAIGCDCIQIVRGAYMSRFIDESRGLVMIVDEEGLIAGRQRNLAASLFYGTPLHGEPIVGDVLIVSEEMSIDGPELAGLEEEKAAVIAESIKRVIRAFA